VVDKNGIAKSKEIAIKGSLPDLYIVKDGISINDKILLEGVQKVKDNDRIKYAYQQPAEVLSHLKLKAE